MGYASASDVAVYCDNLIGGASTFDASTCPTLVQVNVLITSGCGVLHTHLNSWGYSTPVTAGTALYEMLMDLNALYAAARAELSRINITLTPGERTRGQVFDQMFWSGLERLQSMDLSLAGATRASTGKLYAGGISKDDKQDTIDDTDRVEPAFYRNMFLVSGTVDPDHPDADDE